MKLPTPVSPKCSTEVVAFPVQFYTLVNQVLTAQHVYVQSLRLPHLKGKDFFPIVFLDQQQFPAADIKWFKATYEEVHVLRGSAMIHDDLLR